MKMKTLPLWALNSYTAHGTDDPLSDPKIKEIVEREIEKVKTAFGSEVSRLKDEVGSILSQKQITEKERTELAARLEQMQNENLTREQIAKRDAEKAEKKRNEELANLRTESETWRARYTETLVNKTITDAAVENEALRPKQLIEILSPKVKVVPELGEDGKPTNGVKLVVPWGIKDAKGTITHGELPVKDVIKLMKEDEDYINLFKNAPAGGTGTPNRNGKSVNIVDLAKDPAAYRAHRERQKKG